MHLMLEKHVKRPWIARITGKDAQYGLKREFLTPSLISHGFYHYNLNNGHHYDIASDYKRYYARVENDKLVELSRREVQQFAENEDLINQLSRAYKERLTIEQSDSGSAKSFEAFAIMELMMPSKGR